MGGSEFNSGQVANSNLENLTLDRNSLFLFSLQYYITVTLVAMYHKHVSYPYHILRFLGKEID